MRLKVWLDNYRVIKSRHFQGIQIWSLGFLSSTRTAVLENVQDQQESDPTLSFYYLKELARRISSFYLWKFASSTFSRASESAELP